MTGQKRTRSDSRVLADYVVRTTAIITITDLWVFPHACKYTIS